MMDPTMVEYGREASRLIMRKVLALPVDQRTATLRAVLTEIDPSLWHRVDRLASTMRLRGISAQDTLERALASEMAGGIQSEILDLAKGHMSMGYFGCCDDGGGREGMGFSLGKLFGGVGSVVKDIVKGVKDIGCKAVSVASNMGTAVPGPYAVGVNVAANMCGGGGQPQAYMPPPQPSIPWMPILLIGGGLLAVIALKR